MDKFKELTAQVDNYIDEIIQLEQELIKIESVKTRIMPTGNETEACEYVRNWFSKYNIQSSILESVPGRGNIIAKLQGESSINGLMFMSHTDVVPVEDESKWKYPPFAGVLDKGRIYGRGASDCKGLLTAQMMAMRLLNSNEIKLKENLILVSGADEEHGGRYGFGWLAENHPEKITAKYAVNEGGGNALRAAGTSAYLLGVGEKGRLQLEISIKGTSAHASTPWQGSNALFVLGQVVKRIEDYQAERDVSLEFFKYLSNLAIEDKPTINNIDEIISGFESENKHMASMLKAQSRMTITPTMVHGGVKSNSVPESINLTCDVRTLPHQDQIYLEEELAKIFKGINGLDYTIDYMAIPNSSPYETSFIDTLKDVTQRIVDRSNLQWVPAVCSGFTDSRFTRNLGVETYGFMGAHPDDDPMVTNIHGTDESESVKSLVVSTKIMLGLAYELLAI